MKYILFIFIFATHGLANAFANVNRVLSCTVEVKGEIKKGDLQLIINEFKKFDKIDDCNSRYTIEINSRGGDVDESLNIGRYIRQKEMTVWVSIGGECYSSCIFILVAGVTRFTFGGKVGIHRPYFNALDKSLTMSEIKNIRDKMSARLRDYFQEMNVNPSLIDAMNSVAPEEIKILSEEEIKGFGIGLYDPNYDERDTARMAYLYNMTSAEYRFKWNEANASCKGVKDYDCRRLKILNISKDELDKRTRIYDLCMGNSKTTTLTDPVAAKCFRKTISLGN